jgi:hypothetical protein
MLLAAFVVVAGLVVSLTLVRHARASRIDSLGAAEEVAPAVPIATATEELTEGRAA